VCEKRCEMKSQKKSQTKTVRRSVAVPRKLIEEIHRVAPPDLVGTDARNVHRDYPTNVRVTADETGLSLDTVFLCFQIRSLDHSRFMDPVTQQPNLAGKMPDHRMADVENALQMTLMI